MRLKIASFLLMAGTVVGCASNPPPPPPPMAMAPEPAPMPPAPAPVMSGGTNGVYRGMAELAPEAPRRCRKMTAMQTARVRNGMIALGGMSGKIGPDGTITAAGRRGGGLTGTVSGNTADITTMRGGCSYHYTLTQA